MKKTIFISLFTLIIFACDTEDDSADTPVAEEIELLFTTQTEEDQITGFADNAMAVYDDKVWIVGGYNDYHPPLFTSNADVWASDNGVNWFSVSSNQFGPRLGHTLTNFTGKLWMIGGINDASVGYAEIWSSTDGLTWTLEDDDPVFGDVYHHTLTIFEGKLILIYGSSVWESSNALDWTLLTNSAFANRNYHKTVVFNNELYVVGGITTTATNEIWKSADGITWTQVTPTGDLFSPRRNHTLTIYNNKAWLIGGTTGTTDYADLYYSEDMVEWKSYSALPGSDPIYSHNVLNYDGKLWLFGGYQLGAASSRILTIEEL